MGRVKPQVVPHHACACVKAVPVPDQAPRALDAFNVVRCEHALIVNVVVLLHVREVYSIQAETEPVAMQGCKFFHETAFAQIAGKTYIVGQRAPVWTGFCKIVKESQDFHLISGNASLLQQCSHRVRVDYNLVEPAKA